MLQNFPMSLQPKSSCIHFMLATMIPSFHTAGNSDQFGCLVRRGFASHGFSSKQNLYKVNRQINSQFMRPSSFQRCRKMLGLLFIRVCISELDDLLWGLE